MYNTESKNVLVFLIYKELLQTNKKNIDNAIAKKGQKVWIGRLYTYKSSKYLSTYENTIDITHN